MEHHPKRYVITFFTIMWMVLPNGNVWGQHYRYDTQELERLAQQIGQKHKLDTLTLGLYVGIDTFLHKPLTVEVRNRHVTHIGYSIFSQQLRTDFPSPVYNFIERYALAMDIPREENKFSMEKQMEMDRVNFSVGSLQMLPSLFRQKVSVDIEKAMERFYRISWTDSIGQIVCRMTFPSSYELMHGSEMLENEERIVQEIRSTKPFVAQPAIVNREELDVYKADGSDTIYIHRGGHGIIEHIRSDKYYVRSGDGAMTLLYSPLYPYESLCNLFTSEELTFAPSVHVLLRKYNFQKEELDVQLTQLRHFFYEEQCTAYCGLIDFDEAKGEIDMIIQMVNKESSYEHLMRLRGNPFSVTDGQCGIHVTLTSYIPLHNVAKWYAEE